MNIAQATVSSMDVGKPSFGGGSDVVESVDWGNGGEDIGVGASLDTTKCPHRKPLKTSDHEFRHF